MKPIKSLRPGLLPVISLVVVVAWALFAVAMLTGTLLTTQQINTRVTTINTVLPQIDHNLDALTLATQTGQLAGQINDAVKPVGPAFTQVVAAAGGINTSVQSIAGRVAAINAGAQSIDTAAKSINGLVVSIGGRLNSIDDHAESINDSVHSIGRHFDDILDRSHSIRDGVRDINERAGRVIDVATRIREDIRATRDVVPQINQNAHAIAHSPVLNPAGALNPLLTALHVPALRLPGLPVVAAPVKKPSLSPLIPTPSDQTAGTSLLGALNPSNGRARHGSGSDSDSDNNDDSDPGLPLVGLIGSGS